MPGATDRGFIDNYYQNGFVRADLQGKQAGFVNFSDICILRKKAEFALIPCKIQLLHIYSNNVGAGLRRLEY